MDKINFENLPSTNTPLDANTLNGMQSNIEKSVVAIGSSAPSTNENVWLQIGTSIPKKIMIKNSNNVFEEFADISKYENATQDTGWTPIEFTSNDWKAREGSTMYAPKFRKIGDVVFLQGQFATNQILNPGTYNIVTTNLPAPDKQHTICTCSYTGKLVNMWIVGKTISLRVFDNNFNDAIGVSIDSCYIELTTD